MAGLLAMALVYQPTINALKRPHTSRSTTGSGRTMYHERSRADHRSTGLPKNVAVSDVMPVSMSRQPMLQVSSVLDGQDGNIASHPSEIPRSSCIASDAATRLLAVEVCLLHRTALATRQSATRIECSGRIDDQRHGAFSIGLEATNGGGW